MISRLGLIVFLLLSLNAIAQREYDIDSLRRVINEGKRDTNELLAMSYYASQQTNVDSGILYAQRAILLAKEVNDAKAEADCLLLVNEKIATRGYFNEEISYLLKALHIYESLKDTVGVAESQLLLQGTYRLAGDFRHSLEHALLGDQLASANHIHGKLTFPGTLLAPLFEGEISKSYFESGKIDSSYIFAKKAIAQDVHFNGSKWNFPIFLLATIQTAQGKYDSALKNYRDALPLAVENNFPWDTLQIFGGMSTLYLKKRDLDSSIFYGKIVTTGWTEQAEIQILLGVVSNLAQAYKLKGNKDSALRFVEMDKMLKDSIYNSERMMDLQHLTFNEQFRQQEIASAQLQYRNKVRTYALGAGFILLFLVASFLWRNNQLRRTAYRLLENQKQEIAQQKEKIEETLDELKTTQTQLIQSAKMASLGELTAGIAHEIQNPLNFVNNFSEVNMELVEEMKNELSADNKQDAISIANNIKENEEKINHHGKRADAIVKSMLQHSGNSTGQKEQTDINALANEYLRLSYHGLRATNKTFNATIQTNFDESIGKINIVSQSIGRVLLNLYNNAFFAVMEKQQQQGEKYEPIVSVTTKKLSGKIEIRIRDNATGISQKVVDKIFQPFFTTKPSGKGTGLGLSLSYDIIVNEHGGTIRVETREGEYTEFIIELKNKE